MTWSEAETTLLTGQCYDGGKLWDVYWYREPCQFVMKRLERPDDVIFGTARLSRPGATRSWRIPSPICSTAPRSCGISWRGRTSYLPYLDWEGPQATYGGNRFFRPLLELHQHIERTIIFRPGLWLAIGDRHRVGVMAGARDTGRRASPSA